MFKKRFLAIALIFTTALVFTLGVNVLQGEDDDTVDGSFSTTGYNNPVEIQELEFTAGEGVEPAPVTDGDSLTPQSKYTVALTIKDADTIADLESLDIYFYHNDGDRSVEDIKTSSDGEELVASWGRNSDGDPDDEFSITTDDTTSADDLSWDVTEDETPDSEDESSDTFTFEFGMTVSKVATESGDWQFGVVVDDGREVLEDDETDTTVEETLAVSTDPTGDGADAFGMDWYGEIGVDSGAEFNWDSLTPGQAFDETESFASLSEAITYISNGAYERSVKADDTWDLPDGEDIPGDIQEAILTEDTSLDDQEFRLKVDQSDSALDSSSDIDELDNMPADESYLSDGSAEETEESGSAESYGLYIELADSFQNADYSGQVTFKIADDTVE